MKPSSKLATIESAASYTWRANTSSLMSCHGSLGLGSPLLSWHWGMRLLIEDFFYFLFYHIFFLSISQSFMNVSHSVPQGRLLLWLLYFYWKHWRLSFWQCSMPAVQSNTIFCLNGSISWIFMIFLLKINKTSLQCHLCVCRYSGS